jgi:hypothetical protein
MYNATARAVAPLPVYADGRMILRYTQRVVVATIRAKPEFREWEGMSSADLWRTINVGV